ncbi:MAG: ATP-binding protein [Lachnospiraceae bacterium]|nr:ATP-binding protein [Lachnospiraceae bacterium]
MDTRIRKLPIGIQDFEDIRTNGYLYVDKTKYIYTLINQGKPYFMSRPRRFGKSLFLSTLKAFFEGKRELFEGLAITELTRDDPEAFAGYPVFYFDFNGANYDKIHGTAEQIRQKTAQMISEYSDPSDQASGENETMQTIEEVLDEHLRGWEEIYGSDPANKSLSSRFRYLLRTATQKYGRKAVVLVDEYDKPLLESDPILDEYNRAVFKGFFGTLKSYDGYLRFVFITGVTKFSKVSIFSDLNHLEDISLDRRFSGICGITEREMTETFMPEIEALAGEEDFSTEECLSQLRSMYDGYHFYENCEGVYNPFSLLNAFSKLKFGSYWFESGTPTFLIRKLAKTGFDVKEITEGNVDADERTLSDYRTDDPNPVPLMYQSGYLTIKGYEKRFRSYILGYPNDEVKYGFLKNLVPMILNLNSPEADPGKKSPIEVRQFVRDIESANTDGIRDRLTALFASLPYPEGDPDKFDKYVERDFQNVIYITFMLLGQYVTTQVHNAVGRADVTVETDDYIYIFEFKRDKSVAEALQQIEDKGYALPYAADSRTILKVGVNFDSSKRNINEWEVPDA